MTTDKSPQGAQDEAPELQVADMLLRRQAQRADALEAAAAMLIQQLTARVQELERAAPQWVPVAERLPEFMQPCDWLHHDEIKQECWVLCGESMATASVPGSATHWRPAQPLPPRARGAQGESNG